MYVKGSGSFLPDRLDSIKSHCYERKNVQYICNAGQITYEMIKGKTWYFYVSKLRGISIFVFKYVITSGQLYTIIYSYIDVNMQTTHLAFN